MMILMLLSKGAAGTVIPIAIRALPENTPLGFAIDQDAEGVNTNSWSFNGTESVLFDKAFYISFRANDKKDWC